MSRFPLARPRPRPIRPTAGPTPTPTPGPTPTPTNPPLPGTFTLTNNSGGDATQGETINFALVGPNGTYDYLISGVAANELSNGSLVGTITVRNGVGTLQITIAPNAQILLGEVLQLSVITGVSQGVPTTVSNSIQLVNTNPPTPPTNTFTLTTRPDTATANVFEGPLEIIGNFALNTLTNGDRLTGIGVNPTLDVEINQAGGTITPSLLSGIQTADVDFASINANNTVLSFQNATGLQNVLWSDATAENSLVGLGAALQNLTLSNIVFDADDQNFSFADAALAGNADALNLVLSSITTTGAGTLDIDTVTAGAGTSNYETINIASTGPIANNVNITQNSAGLTTLNVAGATALTTANASVNLTTFNASQATGNITYTAGGEGAASYTGGSGADTFIFVGELTNADTVNGGTGIDTVSASTAAFNGYAAVNPATITNVEQLTVSDANNALNFSVGNIAAGVNTVNLTAGTNAGASALQANAGNFTINLGSGGAQQLLAQITVTDTGVATTDSLTLVNNAANGTNAFNGQAIISTGYETLALTTGAAGGAAQTAGAITVTPDAGGTPTLRITGSDAIEVGVITATGGTVDASGLTLANNLANGLTNAAGNTAGTVIGSGGVDVLRGNNAADTNVSISAGAGADTIATFGGNDTILGQADDDLIASGTGNDSVDGGTGNDRVIFATGQLTANDTVSGGEGTTDTLDYFTFVSAADNGVAAQARVSNFEVLRLGDTGAAAEDVTLTNYLNNQGFVQVQYGTQTNVADGFEILNASQILNTVSSIGVDPGTQIFDRLTDTGADSLTIQNARTGNGGASTFTAFTANDEETITLTEVPVAAGGGANDLTITTLTAADLTTLITSGAADTIITNAIVNAAALRTVNATASTGAVTVNAQNAGGGVTFTSNANSAATNTFTGSGFSDTINGGGGADALVGGGAGDSVIGGSGADTITGGIGADTVNGGLGVDEFVQNVGQSVLTTAVTSTATGNAAVDATLISASTFTFANGVDIITNFEAQDDLRTDFVANNALPNLVVGAATDFDALVNGESVLVYGTFNSATNVFVAAPAFSATTANAALLFDADADNVAGATNNSSVVITGLTAALVAGNFVA